MAEAITQTDFQSRFDEGELVVSMIGMSNMGKSRWSNRLAEGAGFERICCDDEIEARMGGVLEDAGFSGGITDMALWLGQPGSEGFDEKQALYLRHEAAVMDNVLSRLGAGPPKANTVIDTTESVVHTGNDILERLSSVSTVVYLEPTARTRGKLLAKYLEKPKPVIWGDSYSPEEGETPEETLARSYPELLDLRTGLYERFVHVTLLKRRSLGMTGIWGFLGHIKDQLPKEEAA